MGGIAAWRLSGARTQSWASIRCHHFGACPLAQAMIHHLVLAAGRSVLCAKSWLVEQAPKNMQQCVWDAKLLMEVSIMEDGWMVMAVVQKVVPAINPVLAMLELAIYVVIACWAHLQGVVALGIPQEGWALMFLSHPFFQLVSGVLKFS